MKKAILYFGVLLTVLSGCVEQTEYDRQKQIELARGIRNDSLFLGYRFGMDVQDFFGHSWRLNKNGLVVNGGSNNIEYHTDELAGDATMSFYPRFYNGRIYKMPVQYRYNAWAPWNKRFWADSLQADLLQLYSTKYGGGFMELPDEVSKRKKFVKIDGNREIVIRVDNDFSAKVIFTDLMAQRSIEDDPNPDLK